MVRRRSLSAVLVDGPRAALVELAGRLASEIERCAEPEKRLPLVRAFLAVLRDLESLDRSRLREARLARSSGPTGSTTAGADPIDELREARRKRAI
jgi:hypothetical protein